MRILMTTQPALGHFHPMVPLGRALSEAGHEVAFVSSESFCPTITANGFEALPAGLDWQESRVEETFPDFNDVATFGFENLAWWIKRVFAGAAAQAMVPDLVPLVRRLKPDVLVHDIIDFAAPIVGEMTDTPYAGFNWILRVPGDLGSTLYRDEWEALRKSHGLPSDPDGQALWRFLILDVIPPAYHPPDTTPAPTGHPCSPLLFDDHREHPLPAWVSELGARPIVYATLGTVFNRTPGLLQKIIDALADEDISLIVTVGPDQDPESYGPQPENVHIERYIPQTALFPACAAVVTHGGYNTVMTALAHGLPMVITPISADQIFHSTRCMDLGAALVVEPADLDAEQLRQTLRRLLQEPDFRTAARKMRTEIESLPGIEGSVGLIEELAEEKTPRLASDISVSPSRQRLP